MLNYIDTLEIGLNNAKNRCVLVAIDNFNKWAIFKIVPNKEACTMTQVLVEKLILQLKTLKKKLILVKFVNDIHKKISFFIYVFTLFFFSFFLSEIFYFSKNKKKFII